MIVLGFTYLYAFKLLDLLKRKQELDRGTFGRCFGIPNKKKTVF